MINFRSRKKLIVYQKAMDFVVSIYALTESFPRNEEFGCRIAEIKRNVEC